MADLPIGRAIRRVRRQRKLTQAQLAAKMGLSYSNVSKVEREYIGRSPRMDTFDQFAIALEITPWELMLVACNLRERLETR